MKSTEKAARCPACGRLDIRPSVVRGIDKLMRAFRYTPYRCRACSHRFYRRLKPEEPDELDLPESDASPSDSKSASPDA